MRVVRLSKTAYADYVASEPSTAFTQLPGALEARERQGVHVDYLGLEKDGAIIAACAVRYQPWKKFFRRANIAFGPTFTEFSPAIASFFLTGILDFLRKQRTVLSLRFNPNMTRRHYSDITPGDLNPQVLELDTVVERLGGSRNTQEFYDSSDIQVHYVYVKDLEGMDMKAAVKSMAQPMRTGFNRWGTPGLSVRYLGVDEFDTFVTLLNHTADRTDMSTVSSSSYEYYRDLMETMPDKVRVPVAVLDCPAYLAGLEAERAEIQAKVDQLEAQQASLEAEGKTLGKKQRNALNEHTSRLEVIAKRHAETREHQGTHGDEIILAGSYFVHAGNELVYLLSGAFREFQSYFGIYLIHKEMVEWAIENGVTRYNTFGITGDFSENASDAGVLHFKRQFNGNVEEYAGTYDIPVRPFLADKLGATPA